MPTISTQMRAALGLPSTNEELRVIGRALLGGLGLQQVPLRGEPAYDDFLGRLTAELDAVLVAGSLPAGNAPVVAMATRIFDGYDIRGLVGVKFDVGWAHETTTTRLARDRTDHVRQLVTNLLTPRLGQLLDKWVTEARITRT